MHPIHRLVNIAVVDICDLKCVIKIQREVVSRTQTILRIIGSLFTLLKFKYIHQPNILRLKIYRVVIVQPIPVGKAHCFSVLCFPKIILAAIYDMDRGGIFSGSADTQAEGLAIFGIAILRLRLMVYRLFDHLLTSKFH